MNVNMSSKIKEVLGKHATRFIFAGMVGLASFTFFLYDQVVSNEEVNIHQQTTLDRRASKVELVDQYIKSNKLQEDMLKQLCGEECEHLYKNKNNRDGGE